MEIDMELEKIRWRNQYRLAHRDEYRKRPTNAYPPQCVQAHGGVIHGTCYHDCCNCTNEECMTYWNLKNGEDYYQRLYEDMVEQWQKEEDYKIKELYNKKIQEEGYDPNYPIIISEKDFEVDLEEKKEEYSIPINIFTIEKGEEN